MFRGNHLVMDGPKNWLEAVVMAYTLVFCNLKARRVGADLVISKECW